MGTRTGRNEKGTHLIFFAASQLLATIDPLGRRISTLDANTNRVSTSYDAAGRAIAQINGLGYLCRGEL